MGVILFAILCGRLPFEGSDISGSKKPRDAIIKSKIMKCQYKIDDNLTSDAKVTPMSSPSLLLTLCSVLSISFTHTHSHTHTQISV